MSLKSSLLYLPPNLRNPVTTPLYPSVAGVYDKALELAYLNEINKLKSLYDPSSEYFDTDYILNLLGESTLKNLLSDITDKISLTMIVSDIQNIKGTKKAFYAILRLLKIQYKTIVFNTLDNGCTEVTIVFEQGQRINIDDIALLDKYAQEIFPLCLSLTGVTNCIAYQTSASYTGFNSLDLGMHYLDRTFTLDMSKLDETYGVINKNISSTIAMLICNATRADPIIDTQAVDSLPIRTTNGAVYYGRGSSILLDINLKLDRFNPVDYYGFSTTLGKVSSTDAVYRREDVAKDDIYLKPKYAFRLDESFMDISPFEPMDGLKRISKVTNGLDKGITLDFSPLDRKTVTYTAVTHPQLRVTLADMLSTSAPAFTPYPYTYKCKLDYGYASASSYLPMLNI